MKRNGVLTITACPLDVPTAPPQPEPDGATRRFEGSAETVRKIEQSIAYMLAHLHQPLRVSTLAQQASVSPSHFFALFKRRTGAAPIDYFTQLRMRHACRLLHGSSASVKEVAATLGYEDPFYFSRVFKSVNHVSPSQYRAARQLLPSGANGANGIDRTNGASAVNGKHHNGIPLSCVGI